MTAPVDQVSVAIVPDFGRFPAEMRRGVDQAMRELAARVDAAMTSVEGDFREAATTLGRDMQVGGEVAEQAFRELNHVASAELASIDAKTAASAGLLGGRFKAAAAVAGTAFLGAGAAVGAALGAITFFGVKAAASMEQTQIQFKSLLGSVELGNQVLRELQKFAAETPFEFADITPVAARFFNLAQTLGMAKTQVTEFLTVLGNIASVTGGGAFAMERVAFAMGQIASKGRLSAQDVNQIGDALVGFNVRAGIAAELGLSTAEAMQAMENGTITSEQGLQALMRAMAKFPGASGAMVAQSQTLVGLFSTFKDTINLAMIDAFTPVIPLIKASMAGLNQPIADALKALAPALGGLLVALLKLLVPLVKAFALFLGPLVDALGKAIDNVDPKLWDQLTVAMVQLAEAMVPLVPLLLEFMVGTVELAIPVLMGLAKVLRLLAPAFDFMTDAIHEFNRAMVVIDWAKVDADQVAALENLWGTISGFFGDVVEGVAMLPEAVTMAFQGMVDIAAAKIKQLIDFVKGLPKRLTDAVASLKDLLVEAGANVVRGLWRGITGMAGWLYGKVKQFAIDNTIGAIKDALGIGSPSTVMASEVGRWIPAGIGVGVQQGTPGLRDLLNGLAGSVVNSASPAAASGGLGGISFGAGSIVIQYNGAVPTPAQARENGMQVGQGILDAISRRNVTTAVRQRA